MAKLKTTEQLIVECRLKHGNKYDYSLVEYTGVHNKVWIVCPFHGKFQQAPTSHLKGIGCKDCGLEQKKLTNIERFGVDNPRKSAVVKDKIKATNLERHGVENPSQSEEIRDKMKATNIERYGHTNPRSSEVVKAKTRATNLERYGHENIAHGTKKTKIIDTNLERYGHYNPFGSDEIKEKIQATNMETYGTMYPNQQHMIDCLPLLQSKDWIEYQYYSQKKTFARIAEEIEVSSFCIGTYAKFHGIEPRPNEIGSSCAERVWIEGIMEAEGIFIRYSGNGQQYKIPGTNWRADGYCEANNTIYEYHGSPWHGNPRQGSPDDSPNFYAPDITREELYQKTKAREQMIVELGYNLVVMWDDGVTYSYLANERIL